MIECQWDGFWHCHILSPFCALFHFGWPCHHTERMARRQRLYIRCFMYSHCFLHSFRWHMKCSILLHFLCLTNNLSIANPPSTFPIHTWTYGNIDIIKYKLYIHLCNTHTCIYAQFYNILLFLTLCSNKCEHRQILVFTIFLKK